MLFQGQQPDDPIFISSIGGLTSTLNSKVNFYSFSLSHASTSNAGSGDSLWFFGGASNLTAFLNNSGGTYFNFPYNCQITGFTSTMTCSSPGQGVKSPSSAKLIIQNIFTGQAFDLLAGHDYSKSFETLRRSGLNINLLSNDKFAIRVEMPGYSTSNPSGFTHSIVFYLKPIYPSITYLGYETGQAALQFMNQSVVKKFARGIQGTFGANQYGSNGYYLIRPVRLNNAYFDYVTQTYVDPSDATINEPVYPNAVDLGISASPYPTVYRRPSFLLPGPVAPTNYGTIKAFENQTSFVNYPGYATLEIPTPVTSEESRIARLGAISGAQFTGPFNTPDGLNDGYFVYSFDLTIAPPEFQYTYAKIYASYYALNLRIGVFVDCVGDANYAPDYVSVWSGSNVGGPLATSTFSELLPRNGTPKLVFFEFDILPSQDLVFFLWKKGSQPALACSGVIFD